MRNSENMIHHINIRVPASIYKECEKLAKEYSITISAMARIILKQALANKQADLIKTVSKGK